MKQIGSNYHKKLAALVIMLALSALVIVCHVTGILDKIEYRLYDLRINLLAERFPRSGDIYLIVLDQESLDWAQRERGWGWPWPRKAYAEFVDYMNLAGAKSVIFDVLFSEPSIYRNAHQDEIIDVTINTLDRARLALAGGRTLEADSLFGDVSAGLHELNAKGEDDASFAEAAGRFGRVVQGVTFTTQAEAQAAWPRNLNKPVFAAQNFGGYLSEFGMNEGKTMTGAQFPIRELSESAGVIGSLTGIHDSDNIFRRHRLFTLFDNLAVPGLAASALLASGEDRAISYDPQKKQINWGPYTIPVDDEGKTLLRFRGAPLDVYLQHNMAAILQSAEAYAAGKEPLLPPDVFTDCYIFFGFYAQGLFDTFPTPIASVYPGVGVHITMLDNMLMGDFITKAPDWIAMVMIAAAVILMVILALFSGRVSATVAGFVVCLAGLVIAAILAFAAGYWIPVTAPALATILSFLSATLYSYATEGKDKRFIKHAFSRILSPKVIDQIIADPSQLKLGGEKRKMTAIFTDIQRFSSISSELQDEYGEDGPKVLVDLLNLYLTQMSDIILANGGTVDKYEGDAIIAFFGAPVWAENHAALACRSAIQMKKREQTLKEEIMNPEGEFHAAMEKLVAGKVIRSERPLYTRLGINTGDMVVGFMGTPAKMDYTIMGNAVNLAARLEGVNKQYDTHGILISEYTRDQIGDDFILRPLSRVTVVGIPVPVRLFELLDIRGEAPPEMPEMVTIWEKAFALYEKKKFPEAKKIFAELLRADPADSVARLYLDRCESFIATPPPSDWDSVDNLTEK